MKKTTFIIVLILSLSIISSCKNEPKNTPQTNGIEAPSDLEKSGREKLKMLEGTKGEIYTRKLDCQEFYESIDFSSLCFTSDKTPKIQPTPNRSGNNCQYKIFLDDYSPEVYVLVNYRDFKNSIYNDEEIAKSIFEQKFKRDKKSKILYTKTINVNLEEDAFFYTNERNKQQGLSVKMGNVVITIQVEEVDKTNPCLLSNDELVKFAKLIIERVKN